MKRIGNNAFLSCNGFGLTVVGASTYGRIDFLPSLGHDIIEIPSKASSLDLGYGMEDLVGYE